MEELKTSLDIQNKNLKQELKNAKDNDSEMAKKYEALKKKFDSESVNKDS